MDKVNQGQPIVQPFSPTSEDLHNQNSAQTIVQEEPTKANFSSHV